MYRHSSRLTKSESTGENEGCHNVRHHSLDQIAIDSLTNEEETESHCKMAALAHTWLEWTCCCSVPDVGEGAVRH